MRFFLFILLISCFSTAYAQKMNTAKLDSFFQVLEANQKFMGSVAVSKNGKLLYTQTIGFENADANIAANEQSLYRIGSITKIFTGALVMKAVEEGYLTLSQTLDTFYPDITNADIITLEHLLYHRTGIHDFTADAEYLQWMTQPKSRSDMLEIIKKGGSDFRPDSIHQYSNSNYVLLSYVLEEVYKKPYGQILEEKIVKPLGLTNTYFGADHQNLAHECSSYDYDREWKRSPVTHMTIPMGAGAIISTPLELIKFGDALFSGEIISMQSVEKMKTMKDGYGMGMFKVPFYEKSGYGHTGGIDGFRSFFYYFPEDQISFAVTGNGIMYKMNDIAIAVLSAVYDKPYSIPDFTKYESTPEELALLIGTYTSKDIPVKFVITQQANQLYAEPTGQENIALEATGPTSFKYDQAGVVIEFSPEEKTMKVKQGGMEFNFRKE